MVEITTALVKELRTATNAGVLDCKNALQETGGNMQEAVRILREKGLAVADKKAGREAKEGLIASYIHFGGRIGVLLELNCESDFVARTEIFQALAHDLAMQVAAQHPLYVQPADVPPDVLESEKDIYRKQAAESGKPAPVIERIVEGKLKSYYEDTCLLLQPFIRDTDVTIEQLIKNHIAELGENIVVRRFVRYELGS
ncbi:MAG: translation elongation factor Ts [Chloroflexi bacterium]|nr:translation elongation factor Ts [Chloroflexota bacterium]MBU1750288.1 translation elongation factor Ts [Chloroflexota bacterium]